MKKFTLLLLIISGLNLFAQVPPVTQECKIENKAFQVGEKLTYKFAFKWGAIWLSAGEATLSLEQATYNNKPCIHVVGYGETYKSYDWFFKVRDKYESYIDPETILPYKFVRDVNEGGYTIYNNVTFKQSEGKVISTSNTSSHPTPRETTTNISSCIQDVLSAVYYARCLDFSKYKPNDTVPLTIFLDDSVYPLHIKYIGKEVLKAKSGTYRCIVFKPMTIKGSIFKGGEEMTIYVTDDENKIPVRIASPILIGEVLAELVGAEGLRNTSDAKLK
jgi:hypothetical protein